MGHLGSHGAFGSIGSHGPAEKVHSLYSFVGNLWVLNSDQIVFALVGNLWTAILN
jgi:hypothetical protein